ncbi:MAG: amidoligase family protein [Planctomycetaceae bacterium]|nr:amidoligase family protein [Planctomycetaceae bacterium]
MTNATRNTDINGMAKDFTFGVEIETVIGSRKRISIGEYHRGIQVPYLPEGWTAEKDSSIRYARGMRACEIVSPILKGEEGIKELIKVIGILKDKGHQVNETCSVHFHIGFGNKTASDLAKLIKIVAYLEHALYAITGTKARERGTWCGSVKRYDNAQNYQSQMAQSHSAKYKILNIKHLANGGKGTVEFRCFSGSLNPTKIIGWVQVCLGIVEKALTCKRLPSWNGKNPIGVWKKDGAGETEVERLLAYLCWGNYGKYAAHQRAYGWVSNEINQKDIKETFRTLAKKYDSQN